MNVSCRERRLKIANFFGIRIESWVAMSGIGVSEWIEEIYHKHSEHLGHLIVGVNVKWVYAGNHEQNPIAMLNFCVGTSCLLFRIFQCKKIPNSLRDFLCDPRLLFVGMDIESTRQRLLNSYNMKIENAIDLLAIATVKTQLGLLDSPKLIVLMQAVLGRCMANPLVLNWNVELGQLSEMHIEQATNHAYLTFRTGLFFLHL